MLEEIEELIDYWRTFLIYKRYLLIRADIDHLNATIKRLEELKELKD